MEFPQFWEAFGWCCIRPPFPSWLVCLVFFVLFVFVFILAFGFRMFVGWFMFFDLGSFDPNIPELGNIGSVDVITTSRQLNFVLSSFVGGLGTWCPSPAEFPLNRWCQQVGYAGPREAWDEVIQCVSCGIQGPEVESLLCPGELFPLTWTSGWIHLRK